MAVGYDPYADDEDDFLTRILDNIEGKVRGSWDWIQEQMEESNLPGYIGGTGVEIGGGYVTDLATASLLNPATITATGGWSILGYGLANFTSGASTNIAAQKIRGEEEIGWGEVISSGLIDIIPFFGQKLKGAKGITNVALQSGARTVAQRQGEVALDDQRWLTPRETLEAAALGGAFGAGFKGTGEGINLLRSKYGKYDLDDALQRFPGAAVQEMIAQGRIRETPREALLMLTERLNRQIDGDDLPTNVVPGNVPRPLPGRQHVSGMVPRIRGEFNGKQFDNTTLDPDLEIPWNLVRDPQEKGRQIAGFFVDQASNPTAWNRLNKDIRRMMERKFPGWDLPLQRGETPIGGWAGHHSAPVKQMAWSVNGLSNEAREEAANYIAKRIGQRLGYSSENLDEIPAEFHVYIHRMLNDAIGRYDVSNIERIMNLEPGGFSKLELWDRQRGFDIIADNIIQSRKDIYTFMTALANQSKRTDVSPEVLVDSMENLLDLQHRIRLKPDDRNLTQIINKFLGRSDAAIDFVEDQISAAERPIKNLLYKLALEDLDKAKKWLRAYRGGTPGGPDLSPGMFPDD